MRIRQLLFVTSLCFGLQACLLTPDYRAVAVTNQTIETETHFSRVVSHKNSVVSVEVDSFIDSKFDYPSIYIGLHNSLTDATSIALSDIIVEADGELLTIKNPALLAEERQNRLARLTILYNGHEEPRRFGQNRDNRRQNRHHNVRFDQHNNDYSRYVDSQLMNNEMPPDSSYGGYIAFDRLDRKVKLYTVTVLFNNEEHVFYIERS